MKSGRAEYLNRNLIHAQAVGALEGACAMRRRLPKRTPMWLRDKLDGIINRLRMVPPELAAHRNEVAP